MEYLDVFIEQALPQEADQQNKRKRRRPSRFMPAKLKIYETAQEDELSLRFFEIPQRWQTQTDRLAGHLRKICAMPGIRDVWLMPAVALAAGLERPKLVMWQMRFAWQRCLEQDGCENLILILPRREVDSFQDLIQQEADLTQAFLQADYDGLNSLVLLSPGLMDSGLSFALTDETEYYRRIYQETGLPVTMRGGLQPPAEMLCRSKGNTLVVNLRPDYAPEFRNLPERSSFLDMYPDMGRQKLLMVKRKDVSYVNMGNILDTYLRKRYNTNRYWESGQSYKTQP